MAKDDRIGDPRVHIVHVIGSLQTGGAEKMLLNYLAASNRERYRHTVLCLSNRGEMADQLQDMGVGLELYRVRFRNFFADIAHLANWFRDNEVKIIHSHMFFASLWSRIAGLRASVPVLITTEHGKEPWKKWWHIKLDHHLSGRTFHHIAVSEDVRNIRLERDGVRPERITMIPNGVPIPALTGVEEERQAVRQEFNLAPDQPVIGTVGRVISAKGYPDLLEALAIARETIPELHWLQVGDGPQRQELQDLACEKGLTGAISFAGLRTDISAILSAMDIWVMSSIFEGLPVALLEAMAARKPIATTDAGGITDAVQDHQHALVVPMNDPSAMAAAIVRLWQDQELAEQLAENAYTHAQDDYGIEAVACRIEALYAIGLKAATD